MKKLISILVLSFLSFGVFTTSYAVYMDVTCAITATCEGGSVYCTGDECTAGSGWVECDGVCNCC